MFVASDKVWKERELAAYRNFPFAPPDYPGAPFRPQLPAPPYAGAPGWKCSVYYYWWEYLRRNAEYRATCEANGQGSHEELYRWFGNVHATDFHTWWWDHMWLFTFVSEVQNMATSKKWHIESEGVFLHVGYSRSKSEMAAAARDEIMRIPQKEIIVELRRAIRFTPSARPVLRSLHQHLQVWDARLAHGELSDAEIFDVAELDSDLPYQSGQIEELKAQGAGVKDLERANARAKSLSVQRHLRIAKQYIDNVALGRFPYRVGR